MSHLDHTMSIEYKTDLQIRRKRSQKRLAADANRSKTTYDLSNEISGRVADIAKSLGCSQSDVAAHVIAAGLALHATGRLDLASLRTPHTCRLRFTHKLVPPRLLPARPASEGNS